MSDSVPLRDHLEAVNKERARTWTVCFIGLVAVGWAVVAGYNKATTIALTAANEKGVAPMD